MTLKLNFLVIRISTLDGRNVSWRRQEVDNGVENQGYALVLERRTTNSQNDFASDSTLTQCALDFRDGEFFTLDRKSVV